MPMPAIPKFAVLLGSAALVAGGCAGAREVVRPVSTTAPAAAGTGAAVTLPLRPIEQQLRDAVRTHYDDYVTLLARAVDIPSGTLNATGVRRVGELFAAELRDLGFDTRFEELPPSLHRGPHLVAVHHGTRGPRLLLIGHLDTVFEGAGLGWLREDSIGHGAGSSDMKGGDVGMLLALRALSDAGLLQDMQITVVMTGDEESAGSPIDVARAALIDAAHQSDIALAFEGGTQTRIGLGRRGASFWRLSVTERQAHS
jgi:glutamate carboxypeptidase